MGSHKSLRLPSRLESPHTPLPHLSRLMGLLSPIILILLSAVDRFWDQLTMSDSIALQLVGHDFSWLAAIITQRAPKETLRSSTIPFCLQIHIKQLATDSVACH